MNGAYGVVWCRFKMQSTPPENRIKSRFSVVGADYERSITYKRKNVVFLYICMRARKTYINYTDSLKNRLFTGFIEGVVSKNNLHQSTPTTPQAAGGKRTRKISPALDEKQEQQHSVVGVHFSPERKKLLTGA